MTDSVPQGHAAVGQPVPHDSGLRHATGEAHYIDDMPAAPKLLHAALMLSPVARGRIKSMDTATALPMPGVVAVLTAADIPGANAVGPIFHAEPALAESEVSYVGEPMALVVADTHHHAVQGAAAVTADIDLEDPVLDPEEARRREEYVSDPQVLAYGDVAEAMALAPLHCEGRIDIGGQDHFYLETQIALASPVDGGGWSVWASTQHPSEVQARVAALLDLPSSTVEVRVRRIGGGFGGKESQATIYAALAALGAFHTNRPVKLRLDRRTDMTATGKRHDFVVSWRAGYQPDGRILGLEMEFLSRAGNVADLSPAVMTRALTHADNCYAFPAVRFEGYCCRTNTVSNTAFRGFGGPQGVLAIEAVIDDVARRLQMPRDAVRAVNYYSDANGWKTPYGQVIQHSSLDRAIRTVQSDANLTQRRREVDDWNRTNPVIRRGLALMPAKFGIAFNIPTLNQAGALVHVYRDGSVRLNHGGTEMGQGLFIKVAQVVAEAFQVPVETVHITPTNTGEVPNTSATAGSTGSDLNGMAALKAAVTIRKRMTRVAASHFECDPDNVRFEDGYIRHRNNALTFGELAERCWAKRVSLSANAHYRTPGLRWNPNKMSGTPYHYYAWGAAVIEAAVDTLTGESRILRADLVQDCGASLNPAVDLGQIEGAFVQGMGWLTCEELYWNAKGELQTVGPSTYKIPGSRDVPPHFHARLLDDAPNAVSTVYRSKAVGEPPLLLAIGCWLAIRDAIASVAPDGVTIPLDAPATPERILMAVHAVREQDSRNVAEA